MVAPPWIPPPEPREQVHQVPKALHKGCQRRRRIPGDSGTPHRSEGKKRGEARGPRAGAGDPREGAARTSSARSCPFSRSRPQSLDSAPSLAEARPGGGGAGGAARPGPPLRRPPASRGPAPWLPGPDITAGGGLEGGGRERRLGAAQREEGGARSSPELQNRPAASPRAQPARPSSRQRRRQRPVSGCPRGPRAGRGWPRGCGQRAPWAAGAIVLFRDRERPGDGWGAARSREHQGA